MATSFSVTRRNGCACGSSGAAEAAAIDPTALGCDPICTDTVPPTTTTTTTTPPPTTTTTTTPPPAQWCNCTYTSTFDPDLGEWGPVTPAGPSGANCVTGPADLSTVWSATSDCGAQIIVSQLGAC